MAHTRSYDIDARVVDQVARGRHLRNVESQDWTIAAARSNNTAPNSITADVIQNETKSKGLMVAPSEIKIVDIMVNGSPWAVTDSGGFIMLQVYDQGRRLVTTSGLLIGGTVISDFEGGFSCTSGVTYDLTLVSGLENQVSEGHAIYSTIVANNIAIQSGPGMITVSLEWVPVDIPSTMT